MDRFFDELSALPNVWELLQAAEKPIALYGMGNGADKVLDEMEKRHIKAAGVMASDDFCRYQAYRGFTVQKESDFAHQLGAFSVALCFGSSLPDVTAHIRAVAERHTLLVPNVPVVGDTIMDEAFIERYRDDIALLDEITTDKDEAFSEIIKLGSEESYLDLGAYNGDTVDEFLRYTGGAYREITALEPNPKNFSKLKAHCAGLPRTELHQLGAWSENTTLFFNNKAGRNSAISSAGAETPVVAADDLLKNKSVTYIKADVEGADYETLLGLRRTLAAQKPKLNFAAYHRFEDVFRLPLLINQLNPEYKIFLRHHPYIPAWDTNLYCV